MARVYNLRVFENLKQTAFSLFSPGNPVEGLQPYANYFDIFANPGQSMVTPISLGDFLGTEFTAGRKLMFTRTHEVDGLRHRLIVVTADPSIIAYPAPPLVLDPTFGASGSAQISVFTEIGVGNTLAQSPGFTPLNSEFMFQGFPENLVNTVLFLQDYLDSFDTANSRRLLDVQAAQDQTRTKLTFTLTSGT